MALLELSSIQKSFPGVKALDNVSFSIEKGEVIALLGENGAGKSTLIKILGGVHQQDKGCVTFQNKEVVIQNPTHAKKLGIGIIFQELNIVQSLSVLDNLFLGSETGLGMKKTAKEKEKAIEVLQVLGVTFQVNELCSQLSIAQQQMVEIAKALLLDTELLIMDEPTASLTAQDVKNLYGVVQDLTKKGIAVIYVSHKLEEIEFLADKIVFLRDGKHITTRNKKDVSRDKMIEIMVGRKLKDEFPTHATAVGNVMLQATKLSRGQKVRKASFELRSGEILGIAGLMGSGRTELVRLIAGADKPTSGEIQRNGKIAHISSPIDGINYGIGLVPEDRKNQGLVLQHTVFENFSLINLKENAKKGWVNDLRLKEHLASFKENMSIKYTAPDVPINNLSGGNQQKIVIAKWLEKDCSIFIFDEPTRGIDVGAKFEIYELMVMLLERGKSIIMVSSELPELLGMSNRILVMNNGSLVGQLENVSDVTQEEIMHLCV